MNKNQHFQGRLKNELKLWTNKTACIQLLRNPGSYEHETSKSTYGTGCIAEHDQCFWILCVEYRLSVVRPDGVWVFCVKQLGPIVRIEWFE